ncbi:MAG: serine hydrolase domain-containing protein [Phycisphaerae bacterium]
MANKSLAAHQDKSRLESFITHQIKFEPFCFQGEKFPGCDFDDPQAVRSLVGAYSLTVAWYDADGRQVERASRPGRYAAVIEIQHSGRVSRRFATLCRMGGPADGATVIERPTEMAARGIAPAIIEQHRQELVPPQADKWSPVRPGDAHSAVLAAGLYDLTAVMQSGAELPSDTLVCLDRQWWVGFKRRFYGYDKKYPGQFICPRPVAGPAAPIIREGTLAGAGMKADALAAIDQACRSWAEDTGIGCGLCIVRRGVLVIDKAWGVQAGGPDKGKPFEPSTAAPLASTTKFLTAILLAEFADQGLIGMDDPVDRYVEPLRGFSKEAVPCVPTIRDLLLHTAGFTGHWGDLYHDLEEVIADIYPTLEVHATHRYQGVGHALAGKIMEMISGQSVPRLFRQCLLDPLGCRGFVCNHTSYGSFGSAMDLARIGQMMLNGGSYGGLRFTGPRAIAQLMPIPGRDRFEPDKTVRWGVGMKLFDSDGLSDAHYGHSGATGSFLKIDPAYDMVLAHTRHDEGPNYHKRRAAMIKAVLDGVQAGA